MGFAALFDGVPVQFASTLEQDAAVKRLAQLIRWGPDKLDMLGEVTAERVVLRVLWMSARDLGTRFEGRVESTGTGSVLTGRFVATRGKRTVSGIGVVFAGMLFIGVLLANLMQMVMQYDGLHDLLVRAGMMLLGLAGAVGLAHALAWNGSPSKRETRQLADAIRVALQQGV